MAPSVRKVYEPAQPRTQVQWAAALVHCKLAMQVWPPQHGLPETPQAQRPSRHDVPAVHTLAAQQAWPIPPQFADSGGGTATPGPPGMVLTGGAAPASSSRQMPVPATTAQRWPGVQSPEVEHGWWHRSSRHASGSGQSRLTWQGRPAGPGWLWSLLPQPASDR